MKVKTTCPPQRKGETFPPSPSLAHSLYFLFLGHQKQLPWMAPGTQQKAQGGLQEQERVFAGLGRGWGEDMFRSVYCFK